MDNLIRVHKFMADCGHCSRRNAERLILEGRVSLNGKTLNELGVKMNPDVDVLQVDGQVLDQFDQEKVYLLFHKPRSVVSTVSDPQGRHTVMDFCRDVSQRIYPVGRLDYLSEGLMILTNDGDLAQKILHPKYQVTKVYEVKVFGHITPTLLRELRRERQFLEGPVRPHSVRVIGQTYGKTWLEFQLKEGRNREIRRICESAGITIDKLKRVAIEGLTCQGIAPGRYVHLSKRELLRALNMNEEGERLEDHFSQHSFQSNKKTITARKLAKKEGTTKSNEKIFQMFKKENYYSTLRSLEMKKQTELEKNSAKQNLGK